MKRSLFLLSLLCLLVLLAFQGRTRADSSVAQGGADSYLPIVMKAPEPTATPLPTETPTPTPPPPAGNGIFKRTSINYYPGYTGTKAFGFVHFFDGSPAYGGPNNFHVWVCFNGGMGCYRSTDLDATGYYDVNINGAPTPPIVGSGYAYLARGLFGQEVRVSQDFPLDTSAGTCWRMDWIECGEGSPEPVCQHTNLPFAGQPTLLPAGNGEALLGCPP